MKNLPRGATTTTKRIERIVIETEMEDQCMVKLWMNKNGYKLTKFDPYNSKGLVMTAEKEIVE